MLAGSPGTPLPGQEFEVQTCTEVVPAKGAGEEVQEKAGTAFICDRV